MRYEITQKTVTFFLECDKREIPSIKKFSVENINLTESELRRVFNVMTLQLSGKRLATQRNYLSQFLSALLAYFRSSGRKFPVTSDEWQILLLHFFQFYLTDSHSTATVNTRMRKWQTAIVGIFDFWIAEELLPIDVKVPKINFKKIHKDINNHQLLGEIGETTSIFSTTPQKILVNLDFAAPDAEYLDNIQRSCLEKIDVLKKVCLTHWNALLHDKAIGDDFVKQITPKEIDNVIKSKRYKAQVKGGKASPLASPNHPQGHLWALAIGRRLLQDGKGKECVSKKTFKGSQFFPARALEGSSYEIFEEKTAMPESAFKQLALHEKYFRFLGLLSSVDATAACCLLTIEHPEFTSESILNARLLNSKNKSYLLVTDSFKSSIFSIDKPRAGKRKTVALTPIAHQLIKNIVQLTSPIRNALKRAGDKGWRYLFLGFGRGGRLGPLELNAKHLNASSNISSLARLYPTLLEHGLTAGTFDYRRIRTTMGVLRWFETGSISEMSRRLGNSKRVVLEHYLPPVLLNAWNTRIIRRFQNTLIVLAAHNDEYLLDLTDFRSASDLQHFIAQLIFEYPGTSSPLAKEVQTRLHQNDASSRHPESLTFSDGVLNLQLSTKSLAYLYAFSDFAIKKFNFQELTHVDVTTSLSPSQFIDLACLIRHACENKETDFQLTEILDLSRLRLFHQRAIVELPSLAKRFENIAIKNQWLKQ